MRLDPYFIVCLNFSPCGIAKTTPSNYKIEKSIFEYFDILKLLYNLLLAAAADPFAPAVARTSKQRPQVADTR